MKPCEGCLKSDKGKSEHCRKCKMKDVIKEKNLSYICPSCGMICSECEYYPADCRGRGEIKGKAFWLEYTGEDCCEIYNCCVNQKGYQNCGQCEKLP